MSKLQHRNIVCVFGAVVKDRVAPMLVMEYLEKGSLYDLLRQDPVLEGQQILDILNDVTSGVRFLHNAKPHPVMHGDLKAANVLLDDKGRCKISDFGSGAAGTPFFMARKLLLLPCWFRKLFLSVLLTKHSSLQPNCCLVLQKALPPRMCSRLA